MYKGMGKNTYQNTPHQHMFTGTHNKTVCPMHLYLGKNKQNETIKVKSIINSNYK